MKITHALLALGMAATIGAASLRAEQSNPVELTPVVSVATRVPVRPAPSVLAERFERHGSPAQRAWASSYYSERSQLMSRVHDGRMSMVVAQSRLHSWVQMNRPPMI
jgi:hypothetical protein